MSEVKGKSQTNDSTNAKGRTTIQEIEKQDLNFQTFFDAIDSPLLVLDTKFNIVAANAARVNATGVTLADSYGKNVFEVFPDNPNDPKADGVANLRASLNRALKTKLPYRMPVQKYDIPIPHSQTGEFEERHWSPSNLPILNSDGVVTHIIHRVDDVTAQVQSQQREAKIAVELHGEKVRAEELKRSRLIAESANETKTAFLANMSHEIRTPLTAVIGFSRLLKDKSLKASERDHYVDTILRNGNALTSIIDDILDLAKVEAGKLEMEVVAFSLYELASEAMDLFKDKAKDKGIFLLLNMNESVPTKICSDPTRLRQILVNLIGNAVKFTEKGGVRVRVSSAPTRDGRCEVIIDVKDTGIGLAESQKERLFHQFTQADSTTARKFGGTGLGLALSQRLSHALSGQISIVETQTGVGSTFSLRFSADVPSEAASVYRLNKYSEHEKSISLSGMRVLVVDDSPDNLFLVVSLLSKNGAEVETAADGAEGVTKALAGTYNVVLMDIQMPVMDGYGAKLALDKQGYNTPIIALTAHAMADERAKTKAAGFRDHHTKPLIAADLLQTISSYRN